ncbi:MAG: DUF370 domain-containing protein [Chloroflexi bacterium]|nr:DUF370 domain-containing protein [Chloroflexota bacterium]
MTTELIHIGFGNVLAANRVVAIVSPASAPIKRVITEARDKGILVDMTSGRRTRSVIFMDSGQILLAAITPDTIVSRLGLGRGAESGLQKG